MMKKLMCSALVLAAGLAFAYDGWQPIENCYQLKSSDTDKNGSSFTNGVRWSDKVLPTKDQDCWVPVGVAIRGNRSDFPGKSLTIAGSLEATQATVTTVDYLRLLGGATLSYSSVPNGVTGEITVESTADNPAYVKMTRNDAEGKSYPPMKTWVSTPESKVIMQATTAKPALHPQFNDAYACNFSKFLGTFRIERTAASLANEGFGFTNDFSTTTLTFPKRLEIGRGVVLCRKSTTTVVTVGEFSAEQGAILNSMYGPDGVPFVTVTNSLEIAEGVTYRMGLGTKYASGSFLSGAYGLFGLRNAAVGSAALAEAKKLTIADETDNYWGLDWEQHRIEAVDDPSVAGAKIVAYRTGRPLCKLLEKASAYADYTSTFTNETKWTNGQLPTGEQNAYVAFDMTIARDMANYVFPAGGLMLKGASIYLNCHTLTISNLFLNGGATMEMSDKGTTTSGPRGNTTLVKGDYLGVYGTKQNSISTMSSRIYTFEHEVYGTAPLRLTVSSGTSYPRGGIELKQANTNFHGKTTVASDGNAKDVNSENGSRLRMYLTDARNLGGDLAEPAFDGLTLRGDSILVCDNSVDFNQLNRGVYVQNRIRVVMSSKTDNTFTLSNPLTYGGEFVFGNEYPTAQYAKVGKGGGTLVLAGPARFYDPEAKTACDTPSVTSNRLTMLIGKLCATDADALNGVAVTFGAESEGLVLDWNASDAVKATGFVQNKALSSLTTLRADGKIPLAVENLPADFASGEIAVCTVPEVAAEATLEKFSVAKHRGVRGSLRIGEAVEGRKTIFLTLERQGILLIVR